MLAVLVALLLVSILAGGFFLQARDAGSFAASSMAQTVAATNAEMGLNEAIRRVRSAQLPTAGIGTCTQNEVDTNTCLAGFLSPMVAGPTAADLMNGGGLRYQYLVYKRDGTDPGADPDRYVVRSTGFFGQNLNAPALVTSIVEAEVQIGKGNNFTCTGSYECF